jgi:hypothetical protein
LKNLAGGEDPVNNSAIAAGRKKSANPGDQSLIFKASLQLPLIEFALRIDLRKMGVKQGYVAMAMEESDVD